MPKTEMIDILVTRPAPFWLPTLVERDEKGEKVRTICSKLMLKPGANSLRKERWEQALQHPTVRIHVDVGTLKVGANAAEIAEHTHTPDSMTGLSALTVEKAKVWITASEDIDQLAKWRTTEVAGKGRRGILELVDARTEALLEADEG